MTMKDLREENQILKGDLFKQEIKIQHLINDIAFLKEANALLKQSTLGSNSEKRPPLEEQYVLLDEASIHCNDQGLDSHENAAKEKIPAWPREL